MSAPSPRVAFDMTPVISGGTGIARYVTQIAARLRHDVDLRPFAVGRSGFAVPPNTRHVRVPARLMSACWRALGQPNIERAVGAADLVHATGLLMPATALPLVVTVHDLTALRYPSLVPHRQVGQQRALVRTLGRAAVVVAVSETTAQDVVSLGVSADRVVVAPLGVTPLPEPIPLPESVRPAMPYLLAVGETTPRKGYPVLIRALARLRGRVDLVMVGPPGPDEEQIGRLADELGVTDRLRRLGRVNDGTLAALYQDAAALCFPSLSEGFGLPVLEAMAAGAPVLVSDLPVLREVGSSAAIYVESQNVAAWADAIEALLGASQTRDRLSVAGRSRAAEFSWDRTARATAEAYRIALGTAPERSPF